ncbi:MAG: Bro-N domain-containing protein [Gracilibacteraceae bacterium]|nr:Bro-N domain-containing protein [Gracilibacteraceae bacterium]
MLQMDENNKVRLFEDKRIRYAWDETKEEWYFSVVDVVEVLTGTDNPRRYWSDLKRKLKAEGSELYEKIVQLKMKSADGKRYSTDVANTEQLLRLIQSIPSPKVEPLKMWLAQVGKERIEETIDPEQAIDRAFETYLKKGYGEDWIHQRLLTIRIRNDLTAEWQKRGVEKGLEYAILTDEITKARAGMSTRQYKNLKGLKKGNLRDNMTDLELVLTMLAEATTTEISKTAEPETFKENQQVARRGGRIAGNARREIEADTGKPVITSKNAAQLNTLLTDMIEGVADNSDEDKK